MSTNNHSSPIRSWIILLGLLLLVSACVQFQKISLYDGEEVVPPPPRPEKLSLVVEPLIFDEDSTNLWWDANANCVQGRVTNEVAYSGKAALEVNWDRNAEGCIWAGFGIGWDNYAGKDLSEIMDYVGIEMYVRSKEGKMYGLPIVLTLEDYSGKQAYSYTGNKYFERPFIDEEWQRVVVPLNTFDPNEKGLDPSNIKQLMMELQQSGSIYMDDIRLVFYEPQPMEVWLEEEPLPDPVALPIEIFGDAFINNNAWGLMKDECQTVEVVNAGSGETGKVLHATWDDSGERCQIVAFGASWNKWAPVDITPIMPTAALQFDIRLGSGEAETLPMKVGIQDFGYNQTIAPLDSRFVEGNRFTTNWRKVTIPLAELKGGADLKNIKDLVFVLENKGDVYIDRLRLVEEMR